MLPRLFTPRGQAMRQSLRRCDQRQAAKQGAARRLAFELLTPRRMLAVLTVNTLVDQNDGVGVGGISLRDAVAAAAPNDTINFAVFGDITLDFGPITIDKNLSIVGPGAQRLTIRGSAATIFTVDDLNGIPDAVVSVSGITMSNGNGVDGGAIYNAESLTVSQSSVGWNKAGRGGAIFNTGNLSVIGSAFGTNTAVNDGGGIFNQGHLTVTSSTFAKNQARDGAAIRQSFMGDMTIGYSTIARNSASSGGGGGGGISVASGGAATITHTIIAANFDDAGMSIPSDVVGVLTSSYSFIGLGNGQIVDGGGNQIGLGQPIDPKLGPFTDNGGPTLTFSLRADSPAIDAGNAAAVAGVGGVPAFDQRSTGFARVKDGDGLSGARIDIGAFERQASSAPMFYIVTTLNDESDGDFSPNDLSLREAVQLANANVGVAETISFSPALNGGTILLTLGELKIADSVTVHGPGMDLLTIDASGNDFTPLVSDRKGSRIFRVDDYDLATTITVSISGMTLTGGDADASGGAIRSSENLTVADCKITGNTAGGDGGGMWTNGANLRVEQSTITGNKTIGEYGGYGGGGGVAAVNYLSIIGSSIFMNEAYHSGGGVLTKIAANIERTTIADNLATFDGGGIKSLGTLTLKSSTVSGNIASRGGGIHFYGSQGVIDNSTLSQNHATYQGGGIFTISNDLKLNAVTITANQAAANMGAGIASPGLAGAKTQVSSTIISANNGGDLALHNGTTNSFVSTGYNIIGAGTGTTLTAFNKPGDQTGVNNPQLGPLANNGGPTKTHVPLAGSPALNAGNPAAIAGVAGVPLYEQRGAPFSRVASGRIDIGAVERQVVAANADFDIDGFVAGNDFLAWQRGLGSTGSAATRAAGNADFDGEVDADDLTVWKSQYTGSALLAAAEPALSAVTAAPPDLAPDLIDAAMAYEHWLNDARPAIRRYRPPRA